MERPRRLLFYTHGLVGGGAERVWAMLAAGFAGRGDEVRFAVDFEASENRALLPPDMPVTVLGRGHAGAVRRLAHLIDELRPDVALSAVGASNGKLLLARALARAKPAVVISVHGRMPAEPRPLGRATLGAVALLSRWAERTVAVSEDLRAHLVARWRADPSRTVAVPNPVVLPDAAAVPSAAELAARDDVILALGRLAPEKGFDVLIEALALAPGRLVLLGDGPERPRLEAQAKRLGLGARVEFRGYVAEPWPAFEEAKTLAVPSRSEAFGNVVVEGLAHGLAVVATDCGGPREILEGGRHGRLVPVGDAPALAEALRAALAAPGDPAPRYWRAEAFGLKAALDAYDRVIEAARAER
jgi:glycosyltransferase involved in cell wall biosynthesis